MFDRLESARMKDDEDDFDFNEEHVELESDLEEYGPDEDEDEEEEEEMVEPVAPEVAPVPHQHHYPNPPLWPRCHPLR